MKRQATWLKPQSASERRRRRTRKPAKAALKLLRSLNRARAQGNIEHASHTSDQLDIYDMDRGYLRGDRGF